MGSLIFFKKKTWKRSFITALFFYLIALVLIFIFQRNFLYFPNDVYLTPAQAGVEKIFQEMTITTEDGIALKGWYSPATTKKKTIIFFHGNADSINKLSFVAKAYRKAGYGFLSTEYRGYSGFKGSPCEEGFYADARGFMKALISKGITEQNIILFGHSLGTGVATQMATEFSNAGGLMLLAPFLSIPEMAQMRFPIFPSKYIVIDQFANDIKIPTLNMPVLITHGDWDIVVPFSQGKALYELANEPKEFNAVHEGGHNNLFAKPFAGISLKWLDKL